MSAITRVEDIETLIRYAQLTNKHVKLYLVEFYSDNKPRDLKLDINSETKFYTYSNTLYTDNESINLTKFGFTNDKDTHNRIFLDEQEAIDYGDLLTIKIHLPL